MVGFGSGESMEDCASLWTRGWVLTSGSAAGRALTVARAARPRAKILNFMTMMGLWEGVCEAEGCDGWINVLVGFALVFECCLGWRMLLGSRVQYL